MAETVDVLVDGGKASAGPPLGPALGPLGLNLMEVVGKINEKTKAFAGMKVPVKLTVDPKTKSYDISIGTPPTSALVKKELGLEKGSSATPESVGNLSLDQIKKISDMKETSMLGSDVKNRVLEVAGACVSMGVNIDGKPPKAFINDVHAGKYDPQF